MTPAPRPSPAATGALGNLNRSLNALIPQNPIDYSKTHQGNDIRGAISRAEEAAYAVAAPPPDIVKKAWRILHLSGSVVGRPAGVFYITHRVKVFGKEFCDGWLISQPSPGAPPTGNIYTFGPCDGDEFSPQGGLPTLPPTNHDPDASPRP